MHYGVEADLICLAKGISGGMIPFGAVWTSKKIADHYEENILCCGLTNYAHPLGMAAMKGVLEIVHDKKFQDNLSHVQNIFKVELEKLRKLSIVKDIRVHGLLCAVDLHKSVAGKKFLNKGLYLVAQSNRIILAPPLIITESLLREGMSKVYEVLEENL
jgi:taurine--2-oxoglutarate transaminase